MLKDPKYQRAEKFHSSNQNLLRLLINNAKILFKKEWSCRIVKFGVQSKI